MTLTADQVAARQHGIGSSDAPTVAGVNPYKTALELFFEKRGQWEAPDLSDNEFVRWGNQLETPIAEAWAERTGKKIRRDARTIISKHDPFMLCHIDRRVVGEDAGLEVKCRTWRQAAHYGPSDSDQVLESDIVQVQHAMAVTGWERFYLAVFLGVGDMRHYTIERDQAFIDDLTTIEADFWAKVENNTPPNLDYAHDAAATILDRVYPGTDGSVIDLPEQAVHWHDVLRDAAAKGKEYESVKRIARNHIKGLMGDAAIGYLPDGKGSYTRKLVKRSGHTVESTEYMDFRFRNKPRGNTHD